MDDKLPVATLMIQPMTGREPIKSANEKPESVFLNGINPLTHGWFFHMGIRNKKVCKVKNFQVWVTKDYFE